MIDLTDSKLDVSGLITALTESDVVVSMTPDGNQRVLKGEGILQKIVSTGVGKNLPILTLAVTNIQQDEVLSGALLVLKNGGRPDPTVVKDLLAEARALPDRHEMH
jgi:hypothetical protein